MYGKMIGEDAYNSLIIEFLRRNLPEVNSSPTLPIKIRLFCAFSKKLKASRKKLKAHFAQKTQPIGG